MTANPKGWRKWLALPAKSQEPAVLLWADNEAGASALNSLAEELAERNKRIRLVWGGKGRAGALSAPSGPLAGLFLSSLKARVIVDGGSLPPNLTSAAKARATPIVTPQTGAEEILSLVGRERTWEERRNRPLGRKIAEWLHAKISRTGQAGNIRRLAGIAQLGDALDHPKTILCLGNGPSSEDETVRNTPHDALFRANHMWQQRGILTKPDLVVTGMQASMKALTDPVIAVLGETTEKVLLMTRWWNFFKGRLDYFVARAVTDDPHFRPTSGAIMLAIAVDLEPDQLIIAGMDMFQDPRGSYPGDSKIANDYTAAHGVDAELAFIFAQLERYRGELLILAPVLARAWQKHKGL